MRQCGALKRMGGLTNLGLITTLAFISCATLSGLIDFSELQLHYL